MMGHNERSSPHSGWPPAWLPAITRIRKIFVVDDVHEMWPNLNVKRTLPSTHNSHNSVFGKLSPEHGDKCGPAALAFLISPPSLAVT